MAFFKTSTAISMQPNAVSLLASGDEVTVSGRRGVVASVSGMSVSVVFDDGTTSTVSASSVRKVG